MSVLDELLEKHGDIKLDIKALDGYKNEKEYIAKAKKKLELPKKLYPEVVNKSYEDGFEHGYIEASVDAYDEIKKLKYMIDNGLGWEDIKNDVSYPPRD